MRGAPVSRFGPPGGGPGPRMLPAPIALVMAEGHAPDDTEKIPTGRLFGMRLNAYRGGAPAASGLPPPRCHPFMEMPRQRQSMETRAVFTSEFRILIYVRIHEVHWHRYASYQWPRVVQRHVIESYASHRDARRRPRAQS